MTTPRDKTVVLDLPFVPNAELVRSSLAAATPKPAERTATHDEVVRDPAAVMRRAQETGCITILGRDGKPRGILSCPKPIALDDHGDPVNSVPALARAYIATLRQCDEGPCSRPITRRCGSHAYCDEHGGDLSEEASAPALRALIAALEDL